MHHTDSSPHPAPPPPSVSGGGKIPPDFLDVAEPERLFQTEEHARALFDLLRPGVAAPGGRAEDRAPPGPARRDRRRLEGPYVGLAHAAAPRMRTGGREVTKEQPHHVSAAGPHLDTVEVDAPVGAVFFGSPGHPLPPK
ncbi:hypothetical protein ACGF3G_20225 [Streptomyces sp. NPDC048179]|uniref:hypothetical protein n=1 Tax=Streptomyces sp. NPDC048179 TaxID=3365506 RepID=UPI003722B499